MELIKVFMMVLAGAAASTDGSSLRQVVDKDLVSETGEGGSMKIYTQLIATQLR
jgi:hypothetical protein